MVTNGLSVQNWQVKMQSTHLFHIKNALQFAISNKVNLWTFKEYSSTNTLSILYRELTTIKKK